MRGDLAHKYVEHTQMQPFGVTVSQGWLVMCGAGRFHVLTAHSGCFCEVVKNVGVTVSWF